MGRRKIAIDVNNCQNWPVLPRSAFDSIASRGQATSQCVDIHVAVDPNMTATAEFDLDDATLPTPAP